MKRNFFYKIICKTIFIFIVIFIALPISAQDLEAEQLDWKITSTDSATTAVAWHPDGTHVACVAGRQNANPHNGELIIYKVRQNKTFDEIARISVENPGGDRMEIIHDVAWHPNGTHIVCCGSIDSFNKHGFVAVYKSDGLDQTDFKTPIDIDDPWQVTSVSWHPNGEYLAFCGGGELPSFIGTFKFNTANGKLEQTEIKLVVIMGNENIMTRDISWHPLGSYVACTGTLDFGGGTDEGFMAIYRFDNSNGKLPNQTFGEYIQGSYVARSVSWYPGGTTIAVGGRSDTSVGDKAFIALYNGFRQATGDFLDDPVFKTLENPDPDPQAEKFWNIFQVDWHPCEPYLAIGLTADYQSFPPFMGYVVIYRFENGKLNSEQSFYSRVKMGGEPPIYADNVWSVAWNPLGNLLASVGQEEGYQVPVKTRGFVALYGEFPLCIPQKFIFNSCKKCHRFPTQVDLINIVSWEPIENAKGYNVYLDAKFTQLFTTVEQSQYPCFCHHGRRPDCPTSYYVVAYNAGGVLITNGSITAP